MEILLEVGETTKSTEAEREYEAEIILDLVGVYVLLGRGESEIRAAAISVASHEAVEKLNDFIFSINRQATKAMLENLEASS